MNPLAFIAIFGALMAPPAYFAAQPYLVEVPVKVYHVQINRSSGGLGGNVEMTANITSLGTATIPTYKTGNLENVPPYHSYLIIKAGTKTTYALVFWSGTPEGGQVVKLDRLYVLISSPSDRSSFTYSSETTQDVNLGTY